MVCSLEVRVAQSGRCKAERGYPPDLVAALSSIAPGKMTPRQMLNKVPEVTLYFWVIKCLCTTIGETFSDNLTITWAGGDNASVHALDAAPSR